VAFGIPFVLVISMTTGSQCDDTVSGSWINISQQGLPGRLRFVLLCQITNFKIFLDQKTATEFLSSTVVKRLKRNC
jgi:hypothetical protein